MAINKEKLSPMMLQYFDIKKQFPDALLFFRLGDFYEMFFEDAKIASRELEITLTGRDCGQEDRAPMCGVPYHSADPYISKLIKKGYKVAVCEQMTDPKDSKGIVQRAVVRIITPGTFSDINSIDEKSNNYLASVYTDENGGGVAFCDITTGDIFLTEFTGKDFLDKLSSEIIKYMPAEIIFNAEAFIQKKFIETLRERTQAHLEALNDDIYSKSRAEERLSGKFKLWDERKGELTSDLLYFSLAAALYYIDKTQKIELAHITDMICYGTDTYMQIDDTAKRNLELTETMRDKKRSGSLFGAIDDTKTPMGARLLKRFICQPLMDIQKIEKRHDAVYELTKKLMERDSLAETLKNIKDIERLLSKISLKTVNARDLLSLKESFRELKPLKENLGKFTSPLLKSLYESLDPLTDIFERIENTICDEPPFTIREGGMIKPGCNSELDDIKNTVENSRQILLDIETREREKTGIKLLRTGYNKVFGYYIEVTKSAIDQVPDYFIRKQTLANCERYITEELKEVEYKLINANSRMCDLEYEEFCRLREFVFDNSKRIKETADTVAYTDVLVSFSITALRHNYCKPHINKDGRIEITDGRHPVVEQALKSSVFVPNDTNLSKKDFYAVITGPNMAGKSTYMRQVALISLMAQIGSFVPASSADICICDKIFTRVGASDDLAMGRSTFMVEMSEVAYILKNATKNSLIILDEIGRGTSTYDGLSIAWAVCEYITEKIKAKTLFATHYHELTRLENEIDGVKNYSVAVKKRGDDLTFLRRIVEGGTDDSYGIEAAKLAGVPQAVIKRAHSILSDLEEGKASEGMQVVKNDVNNPFTEERGFSSLISDEITNDLKKLDVTTLTPIEALNILNDYVKRAKEL